MDISLRDTTEKQPCISAVPGETLAMWETAMGSLKASILQALMRLTSAQERPSRVYTDTFRQLSP